MAVEPNHEEALFNAALDIADVEERARYLEAACAGDADLRARIERLLQASERGGGYFPEDELEETGDAELLPVGEQPGDVVGRYKLLEKIGEGGFGVVFMAEQQEPVRRRVAVKVIKLGMDTRQVIARFEAERQALALMDDPHIARVLDAGSTEAGRPFFVMELVRGIPITEFCENNRLTLEERLRLFIPVCQAIQSAHQKGIIHRDIKPTNILVTLHHGDPMPKVIDFGVAKATNQRLTEKTLFTRFAQMIGTPAYMSPEQATMSTEVDTRTDIYSLGVLLYELLTGRTPFDAKELASAGYDEMRRIIREKEPLRPSTWLTQQRSARQSPKLPCKRPIAADLDWVVMKTLEKDPSQRYETANGLAADLQRFLNDEPVSAVAPTFAYQLGKFGRKHRKAVGAAVALGVILVAATVVSSWQAIRASRAKRVADQQKELVQQQTAKARQQAQIAETMIDFLVDDLLRQGNPMAPGGATNTNLTLREAIRLAMGKVGSRFSEQPVVEASIRSELGNVLSFSGDTIEAEEQLRLAMALFDQADAKEEPRRLEAARWLGWSLSFNALPKRSIEGERLLEEAFAEQVRMLGETNAQTLLTMNFLGMHHANSWHLKRAEELFRRGQRLAGGYSDVPFGLDLMFQRGLAYVFFRQGRHVEARRMYELVLARRRERSAPNANIASLMWTLGGYLSWWDGKHEEAAAMLEEGLSVARSATGNGYPTLEILADLCDVRLRQNRFAEAIELNREQVNGFVERLGPGHLRTAIRGRHLVAIIARHGDWQAAVQELTDQRQRGMGDTTSLAWELMLRYLAKTTNLAPDLRRAIWEGFARDPNQAAAYSAALFLLSLPCPPDELPKVIQLAELASTFPVADTLPVTFAWQNDKRRLLQGLTSFRKGDFDAAINSLRSAENQQAHWPIAALARYFKSMALQQKGQIDEAKDALKQANELLYQLLVVGDLDRAPDGDELFTAFAACFVARMEAEMRILGHQSSEPVTVASLAEARLAWQPVAELLEQADQAGRQRDFSKARELYLRAMDHERFNWPAAFQSYIELDRRMAAAFILSEDLESYHRFCQLYLAADDTRPRVVSSRVLVLHPSGPALDRDLPKMAVDAQKPDYWKLHYRGPALLREGRHDEALEALRVLTHWKHRNEALQAAALAAIAAHKVGQSNEARAFLTQAEEGLKEILELNQGRYEPDWHKQAIIELTLKEAGQLLQETER